MFTQQEVKSLAGEDLEYIFAGQFAGLKTKPRIHQMAALLWARERDRIFLVLGIGTGKTLTALLCGYEWQCKKTLVVCPKSVMSTWNEQIPMHTDFTYTLLEGVTDARRALLNTPTQIHVTSYAGLKLLFGKKVASRKKGQKTEYSIDFEMLDRYAYDYVICDEAHHLKGLSEGSLQARIAYELSSRATKVVFLSGTPFTRELTDLWGEFAILDFGKTLGSSYTEFLFTHFNRYTVELKKQQRSLQLFGLKRGHAEIILSRIAPSTLRYSTTECVDLPEVIRQKRMVEMSPEQLKYFLPDRLANSFCLCEKGFSNKTSPFFPH